VPTVSEGLRFCKLLIRPVDNEADRSGAVSSSVVSPVTLPHPTSSANSLPRAPARAAVAQASSSRPASVSTPTARMSTSSSHGPDRAAPRPPALARSSPRSSLTMPRLLPPSLHLLSRATGLPLSSSPRSCPRPRRRRRTRPAESTRWRRLPSTTRRATSGS
jgi:hypothetical protein